MPLQQKSSHQEKCSSKTISDSRLSRFRKREDTVHPLAFPLLMSALKTSLMRCNASLEIRVQIFSVSGNKNIRTSKIVCYINLYQTDKVSSFLLSIMILLKAISTSSQWRLYEKVFKFYPLKPDRIPCMESTCRRQCSVAISNGHSSEQFKRY